MVTDSSFQLGMQTHYHMTSTGQQLPTFSNTQVGISWKVRKVSSPVIFKQMNVQIVEYCQVICSVVIHPPMDWVETS